MLSSGNTLLYHIKRSNAHILKRNIILLEKLFHKTEWPTKLLAALYQDLKGSQPINTDLVINARTCCNIENLAEKFKVEQSQLTRTRRIFEEHFKNNNRKYIRLNVDCAFNFSQNGIMTTTISESKHNISSRQGANAYVLASSELEFEEYKQVTYKQTTAERFDSKSDGEHGVLVKLKQKKARRHANKDGKLLSDSNDFLFGCDGRVLMENTKVIEDSYAVTILTKELTKAVFDYQEDGKRCHSDLKLPNVIFSIDSNNHVKVVIIDLPEDPIPGKKIKHYTTGYIPFDCNGKQSTKVDDFSTGIMLGKIVFSRETRNRELFDLMQHNLRQGNPIKRNINHDDFKTCNTNYHFLRIKLINNVLNNMGNTAQSFFSTAIEPFLQYFQLCQQLMVIELLLDEDQRATMARAHQHFCFLKNLYELREYAYRCGNQKLLSGIDHLMEAVFKDYNQSFSKSYHAKTPVKFNIEAQFLSRMQNASDNSNLANAEFVKNPEKYMIIESFFKKVRKLLKIIKNQNVNTDIIRNAITSALKLAIKEVSDNPTSTVAHIKKTFFEELSFKIIQNVPSNTPIIIDCVDSKSVDSTSVDSKHGIPFQKRYEQLLTFVKVMNDEDLINMLAKNNKADFFQPLESSSPSSGHHATLVSYINNPLLYLHQMIENPKSYCKVNISSLALDGKLLVLVDYANNFSDNALLNVLNNSYFTPARHNEKPRNRNDFASELRQCRYSTEVQRSTLAFVDNPNHYRKQESWRKRSETFILKTFNGDSVPNDIKGKSKVQTLIEDIKDTSSLTKPRAVVAILLTTLKSTTQRGNELKHFISFGSKKFQPSRVRVRALVCLLYVLGFSQNSSIKDINNFFNQFGQPQDQKPYFPQDKEEQTLSELYETPKYFTTTFYTCLISAVDTTKLCESFELHHLAGQANPEPQQPAAINFFTI